MLKSNTNYCAIIWKSLSQAPQVLFEGNNSNGHIIDIYPYGKFIYFLESQGFRYNYWRYDLETKELNTMFVPEDDDLFGYIMGIHNNEIVYTLFKDSLSDREAWQARATSLTSNGTVMLPLEPQFLSYYYQAPSDDKLYMMPVWGYQELEPELYESVFQGITIYDRNYEQIAVVKMPFLSANTIVLAGDSNYLFAQSREADERVWYILDKSSIDAGEVAFQELLRTPVTSPSIYHEQ